MVARFLRLRVALVAAPLKNGFRNFFVASLWRILLLAGMVGVAWAPTALAKSDVLLLSQYDIAFVSMVLLAAFAVPLFVPRVTLDARLFQQYPLTPVKLFLTLLVTSPLSWLGFAGIVWVASFVWFRRAIIDWDAIAVTALILTVITIPVFARFAGTLGVLIFNSERLKSLQRGIGALLLIAVLPLIGLTALSVRGTGDTQQVTDAAEFFAWTPFGSTMSVIHDGGESSLGIMQLGIQIATLTLLVGGSISLTTAMLTRVDRPFAGAVMSSSTGWFEYLPSTPAMSVGARSLTYWVRDPRYLVSLAAIPMIPVLVLAVLMTAGVSLPILALIPLPLILIMVGWMLHNDIATDSTALWIHVVSGINGVQDRLGRTVPAFVLGIPVLLVGASVTVLILGDWRAFPGVIALGFVSLCASVGLSSVVSVLRPYPTSRPGESPFVQPAWQGAGAGIAQTVAFLGAVALVSPLLILMISVDVINLSIGATILAGAVVYGLVLFALGLLIGGWIYNRRSSELLAFTQIFD